jgi:hypothetical protein
MSTVAMERSKTSRPSSPPAPGRSLLNANDLRLRYISCVGAQQAVRTKREGLQQPLLKVTWPLAQCTAGTACFGMGIQGCRGAADSAGGNTHAMFAHDVSAASLTHTMWRPGLSPWPSQGARPQRPKGTWSASMTRARAALKAPSYTPVAQRCEPFETPEHDLAGVVVPQPEGFAALRHGHVSRP